MVQGPIAGTVVQAGTEKADLEIMPDEWEEEEQREEATIAHGSPL